MGEFLRKFMQLNGKEATITFDHCWFGAQKFKAEKVNVIEDDEKMGIILHGQEKFIYKKHLAEVQMDEHMIMFADDKLKISIKF